MSGDDMLGEKADGRKWGWGGTGMREHSEIGDNRRIKRWRRRMVWIAAALLLLAASASLCLYLAFKQTADRMYKPLSADKPVYVSTDPELRARTTKVMEGMTGHPADTEARSEAFTLLLLGVDERSGDRGRTDTILLITVNPDRARVFQFHIPRDTRTRMVNRGFDDKINHAYAYDGIEGTIAAVEHFLDIPIDYYVQVNMEGFVALVDLLGGVDVDNPFAFEYLGHVFPAGPQHLDGEQALKFARMRYDDPRGDLGRNARQRQVVGDLLRRASRIDAVRSLPAMLDQAAQHVRTNVSFDQMKRWIWQLQKKEAVVETTEIRGSGVMLNGIYYFQVSENERQRLHQAVKDVLLDLTSDLQFR
jgi:LCP family protein required for cell wall assembly